MSEIECPTPGDKQGSDLDHESQSPALGGRHSLSDYNAAFQEFIREAQGALLAVNPLLGPIRGRKTVHSGPFRNVPGDQPLDHPLFTIQASMVVHMGELRDGNVGSLLASIYDFCKEFQDQQERQMFGVLFDVTRAVGNESKVEGPSITADDLIGLEESIAVGYDEDGNPNPISIVCNPRDIDNLRNITWTPQQLKRQHEMRAKKREEYLAAKRTRRLRQSRLRA